MIVGIYGTGATVVSVLALKEAVAGEPVALLFWLFAAFLWTVTGREHDRGEVV